MVPGDKEGSPRWKGLSTRKARVAMERSNQIVEAYEAWNPAETTIQDLVDSLGISRQRLYQVLDSRGVVPKQRRKKGDLPEVPSGLMAEMAEMALGYVIDQLHEARNELAAYRKAFGPLPIED